MNKQEQIKAVIAKPRKVALYASLDMDSYYTVWEVNYTAYDEHYDLLPDGQLREKAMANYVRITEPVEVEFRAITNDEIVQKAVESLNESERALLREMNAKLAELRERKNQLLALTHQPAPAE